MVKVKFIVVMCINLVVYFFLGDIFVYVFFNGLRDWLKGIRVVGWSI